MAANTSPRQNRKSDFYLNLALMTVAVFYLAQIGLDLLVWKTMCGNLGGDYCAYWSAAKLANEQGYAEVLDLEKLGRIQQSIHPSSLPFGVRPIPYFPVFLIPFQALSVLGPFWGYGVWFLINVAATLYYLRYFIRQTTAQPIQTRLLIMLLLSLPMFSNLYFGQINLWLMIGVGEHLRAALSGKTFQAGAWLGMLWLKPQYLIVIGLALLLQKRVKMVTGFALSSVILLTISILMLGIAGTQKLVGLWIGYTGELSAVDPFLMMNWRMIAENASVYIGKTAGWGIALVGIILTLALTIRLWRRSIPTASITAYPVALLGILAATTALTWHSHIFSAIILFAPLAYVAQQRDEGFESLLTTWVLIPPGTQFLAILLAVLFRESSLPGNPGNILNLIYSGGQLGVNLYLLYWAVQKSREPSFFAAYPNPANRTQTS